MRATNEKLRDRARRIVEQAAQAPPDVAAAALNAAAGETRVAIVMLRTGDTAEAARERLQAAGGHLRQALGE
jgi:N-acetylmuramic acid 6-phosphate etherase